MAAITLNVIVQGLLTGLVYGLMALGLSVIFGVMRVVNFAHGEFTVVGMYAAFILFEMLHLDPLIILLPVAAAFFGIGYLLQRTLINPFVGRAEHEQFILLVGLATVIVNVFVENVLQHTTCAPVVVVESDGTLVSISVRDDSVAPAMRHEDPYRGGDQVSGLAIVASVCRSWGSMPTPSGKAVWAVIGPENRL